MITFKKIKYKNFGNCIKASNGFLTYIVTLDVGPRILSFYRDEEANILYEDIDNNIHENGKFFDYAYSVPTEWRLYGGHRFWVGPQTKDSYYPDNHKVEYNILNQELTLIQTVQSRNDLQLQMKISFTSLDTIKIVHIITNKGMCKKKVAPWGITALKGGGLEVVPLPNKQDGYKPLRFISIWDFGADFHDSRSFFGRKYFTLVQEPKNCKPLKIGLKVTSNCAFYIIENCLFKKHFEYNEDYLYPDNNVNFETYTDQYIIEMETLGELKELHPNQMVSHNEYWTLLPYSHTLPGKNNEEEIEQIIKLYLEKTI